MEITELIAQVTAHHKLHAGEDPVDEASRMEQEIRRFLLEKGYTHVSIQVIERGTSGRHHEQRT